MPVRVAINGFGRTGRAMFRAAREQDADVEWVGINDVMGVESLARLLANDCRPRRARPRRSGLVIPELAGRMQGYAVRVPTPTVSMVDLTVEVERATTVEAVTRRP